MEALPALAKLALGAAQASPAQNTLVQALELIKRRTGAVSAAVYYGQSGGLASARVGRGADEISHSVLLYLQQRLVQLRVPLAFNVAQGEVRSLTRAANKQRRDYVAWLVPAVDSWTELLVLRGSWPGNAIIPLLEFIDSAMPALAMILERYLGGDRSERLDRQLAAITRSVEILDDVAQMIGSVAAAYPSIKGLPEDQIRLLRTLAERTANVFNEVRTQRDLVETHVKLQQYTVEYTMRLEQAVQAERQNATTDVLTGLTNHRGALQLLQATCERAASTGQPLSLLMADVDGFKLFNDTYGHITGDAVLKLVAGVLRRATGARGTVCRYGGDEFLVILPGVAKDEATGIAHEAAALLEKEEFRGESDTLIPVRASIGVAGFPDDTISPSKLVAHADAAMYAAKRRMREPASTRVSNTDDTTFGVLHSLVQAIDAKDKYTRAHCDIVAEYAVRIASAMDLPEESRRALRIAGLLHDVGKLIVPDEILKKPAPLTVEEYEAMQRHVIVGEALIREVPQLNEVIQAVACHHERYDGSGYPRGLKGDDIPLIGRIIAIADAYSAMRLDRPYRKGMANDRILNEFIAGAGIQFDPGIARVFVELIVQEELSRSAARQRPAA